MINIAIIGAGQLGSRHLQALASVKHVVNIQVVDPSTDSLKIANERFKEVSENFKGKISFLPSMDLLEKKLDVVIVATNSRIRREVIEKLLDHSQVNYLILEKFLFVKSEDYAFVGNLLEKKKIKTWVNCPRRMMHFYQDLEKRISGNVHFAATGNAWGIGCNGIHVLDLFAFLTNTQNIVLSTNLIDKTILESRRKGYIEFCGTVTGQSDKHSFRMTSFPGNPSEVFITIDTPTARYYIEEGAKGKMRVATEENKWKWEESFFEMPYQSQLTNIFVDEIIATGNCNLTSYKESETLHLLLLENFISFLRNVNNNNSINECPIT